MSDNRKKILEMLDDKKITVDEATKLLSVIDRNGHSSSGEKPIEHIMSKVGRKIKYLRVLIDSPHGHHGDKPEKVNGRVPVRLSRAGMKFTSLIPREAGDKVEEELRCRGINLNIKNIKDEDIDDLIEALSELEVDIDGGDGKVRVFAE